MTTTETDVKATDAPKIEAEEIEVVNYFSCTNCALRERYEYFGLEPPFSKKVKLLEDSYVIEDPFLPPKQGEMIILGAHCIKCSKPVCKNTNCSIFFDGTYCIKCAKYGNYDFPQPVKDKLNKIIM